jgi:hypothetical protein
MTAFGYKGAVDDGYESLPPQEALTTDGYFMYSLVPGDGLLLVTGLSG